MPRQLRRDFTRRHANIGEAQARALQFALDHSVDLIFRLRAELLDDWRNERLRNADTTHIEFFDHEQDARILNRDAYSRCRIA